MTLGSKEIRTWEVVLGWKEDGGKEKGWEGWIEGMGLGVGQVAQCGVARLG